MLRPVFISFWSNFEPNFGHFQTQLTAPLSHVFSQILDTKFGHQLEFGNQIEKDQIPFLFIGVEFWPNFWLNSNQFLNQIDSPGPYGFGLELSGFFFFFLFFGNFFFFLKFHPPTHAGENVKMFFLLPQKLLLHRLFKLGCCVVIMASLFCIRGTETCKLHGHTMSV